MNPNPPKEICIIGSGVIGLSCASLLLEQGWDVTIIAAEDPRTNNLNPEFASLFPAASIIPHSVSSKGMSPIFINSQAYFESLYESQFPGVDKNIHFELFTERQSLPKYASLMNDFKVWDDLKHEFYPRHPEIEIAHGWKFECFFADWSLYLDALFDDVLGRGAELINKKLSAHDISELPFDYIINCAGLGAVELFQDPNDLLYRGHLVQIPNAPRLTTSLGQTISYNFTPGIEFYRTKNGKAQDIYCYPRQDGWVFGGSRLRGRIDNKSQWVGDSHLSETEEIDGLEVPAQILRLNLEMIQHSFGINTNELPAQKAKMGYRYVRNDENGLRVEAEELGDKLIIHNYGHGGSGVTLSWGSAIEVLEILKAHI